MAENTNPSRIKEVQILNDNGTPVGGKVKISPDAADVMVHDASEQTTNHASLQDFLFRKLPTKDTNAGQMRANNEEDPYFKVDPTRQSVWQGWYDYQDITKKRLVGFYKIEGETGEYVADFLLGRESDLQSLYTLELPDVDVATNIGVIKDAFGLHDKSTDNVDYKIPDDIEFNEDDNIDWSTIDEKYYYSEDDKAKELMFSFGDKSFWQAITDRELANKNKLIGIYNKEGECIGHFEATRYNLDALKEVYKNGITVAMDGDNPEHIIKWGVIDNDKAAMDLLVDLSKKSVYQHLIDLKDFWITLPFEVYDNNNKDPNTDEYELGLNIANKNDLAKLHFNS